MTELAQNLVDGLGRGSIYALLALGLAVVFGVLHLLNFAHGELVTVGAYATYAMFLALGGNWWVFMPAAVLAATATAVATEIVAFRRVRGASPFTLLLTSFGLSVLIQAGLRTFLSDKGRKFPKPAWVFDSVQVAGVRLEVYDLVTLTVTLAVLVGILWPLRRTLFGIALRAAAEDFDAARLMGVQADRILTGAFALSGFLAGIAAVLIAIRLGEAKPLMGLDPLLKAIVATIIGGLGSMGGAVIGGFALGLAEVLFRAWLPDDLKGLTDGFVFAAIALLLVFRPHGLIRVVRAERV